jgi:hypothetical protein
VIMSILLVLSHASRGRGTQPCICIERANLTAVELIA